MTSALHEAALDEQADESRWQNFLQHLHLDLPLLAGLLLTAGFGLVILYGATGEDMATTWRQVIRLSLAFSVLFLFAQIPVSLLRRWSPQVWLLATIMLVLVLLIGDVGKGAQRWLDLGVIRFQPSELMKLALPLLLARWLDDAPLPAKFSRLLVAALMIAIPAVLIARQPDLGTSLLIGATGVFALFLSGLRWRYVLGGLAAVAAALPALWYSMHDYQRQRVMTFLNPEQDPLGSGYHIIQSKIAIGSGGLFGKGWLNGTQSQLEFLPERTTDFVFAVAAEELGLFGLLPLLALFLFICWRGLYIAAHAQTGFEKILAGTLSLTFFVYVFVNIGMVIGLLPVVGVPLPLISYGGTSMVTLMAGFGMLMSVHTHRRLLSV